MKGSVSQETLDKRLQNSEENLDLAIKRYVNELHEIKNEQYDIVHSQINQAVKLTIMIYLKQLDKEIVDINDFFKRMQKSLDEMLADCK